MIASLAEYLVALLIILFAAGFGLVQGLHHGIVPKPFGTPARNLPDRVAGGALGFMAGVAVGALVDWFALLVMDLLRAR